MNILFDSGVFEVRTFNVSDASSLVSWVSKTPMDLFMLSSSLVYPVTSDDFIDFVKNIPPEKHKFYSVFLSKSNIHIGHFEIKNIDYVNKNGTGAHIILNPDYRKKGMGKIFIDLIAKVGFDLLGLHRISVSVHTVNLNAVSAYIKAGYIFEGLIREVLFFNEKYYSLYQMSLLKHEWNKKKN